MLEIRPARPADLHDVVRIFLDCWQISYAQHLPAELVARITDESARELWKTALASPGSETIVAIHPEDSRLVGVTSYALNPTGGAADRSLYEGYLASLYVDPAAQGGGIGRQLLAAAEDGLRARGAESASLWVFAANTPSRAFYERQGWVADGEVVTLPEWGEPQARLVKDLI